MRMFSFSLVTIYYLSAFIFFTFIYIHPYLYALVFETRTIVASDEIETLHLSSYRYIPIFLCIYLLIYLHPLNVSIRRYINSGRLPSGGGSSAGFCIVGKDVTNDEESPIC
ncbi:uncharacterized protein F4822DRAFT_419330 [Hypoxylon trugodes]|uniref:uncharacterized protein n=1 Tax=Hypoxylon trugodes TaxID=326681 RepID=UPI002198B8F7|nr:uncharacterized protein F4822DRAFT_419330 [Hypoxylon trugodes]KAI1384319.1 hypothetical protein F4822DRAFT_419330 [Hypoxylon trugodes]